MIPLFKKAMHFSSVLHLLRDISYLFSLTPIIYALFTTNMYANCIILASYQILGIYVRLAYWRLESSWFLGFEMSGLSHMKTQSCRGSGVP